MDKRSQVINEVWSAITHGVGIILSIAALVALILKGVHSGSGLAFGAYLVYGISLFSLYLFSTLFHCLYFTKASRVFQIFDHCGIYLLIAGTYTPYCLLVIDGKFGWGILAVIWVTALGGTLYHILAKNRQQKIETLAYIVMGWTCLLGLKQLLDGLGWSGMSLLFFGGVAFTLGALVYSIKGLKYTHVWWHLAVMLGTLLMFLSIYYYI
ncbi:membrane protein [Ligilactobacillus pabuli]|uniref:Membrane protein n=1 Tax=Ligilactobacillus pabuli TaxID=2886039 RepID=A0ABQ5JIB2_9LACO|nr:hemolysin III family protein [Ligilactobacillus pabuli]GKS80830.1 membrane protein [Ligilactobacillus pabuli]